LTSAWPYYAANYGRTFSSLPRTAAVLELGPGHGSLLAWLRSLGYEHLSGVDASPGDVSFANGHLGGQTVALGDAEGYMRERPSGFDLVVAKAVVEHVPRDRLLDFLEALAGALRPSGRALIDVPNMDWLAAPHERYMDLTHEVGFTRESLWSLLKLRFDTVEIRGSQLPVQTRAQRLLRRPLVASIRGLLYVLGEGANEVLFESRSLIAIASKGAS
jgi:SAM-dependent methyltransferase